MDYEQKHQEDLEVAKGWLAIAKENDNKIAIQILEKFFPELRESEDEKTRKEIIRFIKDELHKIEMVTDAGWEEDEEDIKQRAWFNKVIAWLEKQG